METFIFLLPLSVIVIAACLCGAHLMRRRPNDPEQTKICIHED